MKKKISLMMLLLLIGGTFHEKKVIGSAKPEIRSYREQKNKNAYNYPNPFSNNTTIFFTTEKAGNIIITLFDILGRKVNEFNFGFMEFNGVAVGEYNMKLELEQLKTGIYFYEIKVNGKRIIVNKMNVIK